MSHLWLCTVLFHSIPLQLCSAGYLPDFLSKCARNITIFECGAYYALTGRGGDVMILFLENRILWRVWINSLLLPVQVYRFVSHKYGKRWKPHIFFFLHMWKLTAVVCSRRWLRRSVLQITSIHEISVQSGQQIFLGFFGCDISPSQWDTVFV